MDIANLKARINIADIIGAFIPLRKNGANMIAPCPFHDEKTASFCVSEAKGIYHCFGCGVGGDVFKFVESYKHCDFSQALQIVCDMSGIAYEPQNKQKDDFYKQALNVAQKVNEFFKSYLLKNDDFQSKIRTYLHNRGLDTDDFARFDIGLAAKGFEIQKMLDNHEVKIACELGILGFKERYYSPFSNRITFGIRNSAHKIVAFSARTHPYYDFSQSAKYINSKTSRIFNKSQTLYLLSTAKSNIRATQKAIIVEGYMDAISAHKLGKNNVVASCGTALNKEHLAQLCTISESLDIGLCFDSDEAGYKASMRALEVAFANRIFSVFVCKIKDGFKDLGEILQKGAQIDLKAIDGFKFYVKNKLDSAPLQQKDKILQEIKTLVNAQNFFIKDDLSAKLSAYLKIPKDELLGTRLPQQSAPSDMQKIVYKSILEDKALEYIAVETLESEELGELGQSFLAFIKDGTLDECAKAILLDESIFVIKNRDEFARALKALRLRALKKLLESYKNSRNTQAMIGIQAQILSLQGGHNE